MILLSSSNKSKEKNAAPEEETRSMKYSVMFLNQKVNLFKILYLNYIIGMTLMFSK